MSDNRTRIWFALFVLAIFGLGLATGLFIGQRMTPAPRMAGPPMMRGPMGPGGQMTPGPQPVRLIERLDRVLRLTPEQRERVDAIFEDRAGRLDSIRSELIARAELEQRELQAEIRTVLSPQQQERFDRWLQEAPRGRGGRGRGGR